MIKKIIKLSFIENKITKSEIEEYLRNNNVSSMEIIQEKVFFYLKSLHTVFDRENLRYINNEESKKDLAKKLIFDIFQYCENAMEKGFWEGLKDEDIIEKIKQLVFPEHSEFRIGNITKRLIPESEWKDKDEQHDFYKLKKLSFEIYYKEQAQVNTKRSSTMLDFVALRSGQEIRYSAEFYAQGDEFKQFFIKSQTEGFVDFIFSQDDPVKCFSSIAGKREKEEIVSSKKNSITIYKRSGGKKQKHIDHKKLSKADPQTIYFALKDISKANAQLVCQLLFEPGESLEICSTIGFDITPMYLSLERFAFCLPDERLFTSEKPGYMKALEYKVPSPIEKAKNFSADKQQDYDSSKTFPIEDKIRVCIGYFLQEEKEEISELKDTFLRVFREFEEKRLVE
ncbi:MAG: hypothetical protein HUU50_10245 [Candidatus Brocadiae bacterium]|nr:hypothetical protein [Candidatus Brocadiia bacterium]